MSLNIIATVACVVATYNGTVRLIEAARSQPGRTLSPLEKDQAAAEMRRTKTAVIWIVRVAGVAVLLVHLAGQMDLLQKPAKDLSDIYKDQKTELKVDVKTGTKVDTQAPQPTQKPKSKGNDLSFPLKLR